MLPCEIIRLLILQLFLSQLYNYQTLQGTTRDSYFTILVQVFTNHILAKSTYFTDYID